MFGHVRVGWSTKLIQKSKQTLEDSFLPPKFPSLFAPSLFSFSFIYRLIVIKKKPKIKKRKRNR